MDDESPMKPGLQETIEASRLEEAKEASSGEERKNNDNVEEHECEGPLNGGSEPVPPKVGMMFKSQEEIRKFFDTYASHQGFSVIRKSTKAGDDGKLRYFTLACALSGKTVCTPTNTYRMRRSMKTNCKAKVNIAVGVDGLLYFSRVVLEHNHELSPGNSEQAGNKKNVDSPVKKRSRSDGPKIMPNKTPLIEAGTDKNVASATTPEGQYSLKHALANRAVGLVKSGMVIGLGTGSFVSVVIEELGKLVMEGKLKDIVAVGANYQSRVLARKFGLRSVDLNDVSYIDIAFDGADEVDFSKNLLKGGGAAHTMQKVVDSVAKLCLILADCTQIVHRLGSTSPVPVEVLPLAVSPVLRRLSSLGGVPEIRSALRMDGPVITELGNMVVDVRFPNGIENLAKLEQSINMIPGVIENGIVTGVPTTVLVGTEDGGKVSIMELEEYAKRIVVKRESTSSL